MAGNEQRFVVHAESRWLARSGYLGGLFLVVAAVFIPADEAGLRVFAAGVGLWFLMWSWSVDRRRRVEVTDEHITVVNVFSSHVVPWTELINVRVSHVYGDKGPDQYVLIFVTATQQICANVPYEDGDELLRVRARILQIREPLSIYATPEVQAAGTGDAEPKHRAVRQHRTVRKWRLLTVALAFIVLFPVIYIHVPVLG
jgi:Bacterial PH domain